MKSITPESFVQMPWKNGKGMTREIYRIPLGDDFALRVSIALVDSDGPFSLYPGVHRVLKILTGNGCELSPGKRLTPMTEAFQFSGDSEIFCKLIDGTITDFNIMLRKDWGKISFEERMIAIPEDIKALSDLFLIFNRVNLHFWVLNKEEVLKLNPGHFFFAEITYLQ